MFSFLLGVNLGGESLDPVVSINLIPCLTFQELQTLLVASFYISQVMYEDYALTPNPYSKSWIKFLSSFV